MFNFKINNEALLFSAFLDYSFITQKNIIEDVGKIIVEHNTRPCQNQFRFGVPSQRHKYKLKNFLIRYVDFIPNTTSALLNIFRLQTQNKVIPLSLPINQKNQCPNDL